MLKSSLWLGAAVALVAISLCVTNPAQAELKGRHRIVLMDGKFVDAEVISETADEYVVEPRPKMTMKIRKNQVAKVMPLTSTGEVAGPNATAEAKEQDPLSKISDAEIAELIGDVVVDADEDELSASMSEMDEELPVNEESVKQMERIAGPKAKRLRKPHFVLVYTSDNKLAQSLASRLESVYRWNLRMASMLGIPTVRPQYALEVYFFGTHQEYEAYGNTQGGIPPGAIGFYMRTNNRSAFFDMNTEPGIAELHQRLKEAGVDHRVRQYVRNRIKRRQDFFNLTVVQHEAAHHIHFNIGIFPREGDLPRWLTEGLAQMFEAPPTKLGAGLGAINNHGLHEFKDQYYPRYEMLGDFRLFIVDDNVFFNAGNARMSYCRGWALCHYLWKTKRDKFATFMQKIAKREEGKEYTPTEKQKEFEDLFGTVDEEWTKEFHKFIVSHQVARSQLPDE